ncbi:MAG: sugar phosphate isomerase/epimerase family protein [Armatimonadota bacterium]
MQLSLNSVILGESLEFEQYLDLAGRTGFSGVDFSLNACLQIVEKEGLEAVRDLFEAHGVSPASWGIPVDWKGPEDSYRETLADFPRWAEVGVALGCPRACTWILPAIEGDPDEFYEMAVRRWREIGEIAAEHNLRLGLEWVGPETLRAEGNEFIHTMDGLLEMEEDIGLDNMGLLVDSFHWYTAGHSADELAAVGSEKIVHVHINDAPDRPREKQIDAERLLPGEGIIDLQAFVGALDRTGYDGFMGMETFSDELKSLPVEKAAGRAFEAGSSLLQSYQDSK